MKTKEQVLVVFTVMFAIVVLVGITYTFFSVGVSNNDNEKFQTSTATLSLVFDDGDNGINATLNLGESITKKFTIENTGTLDTYAKINWIELVNTYLQGSLTWNLEQSETENGTYTSVGSGIVPFSKEEEALIKRLLIPVNTKYYYNLIITFNDLDENQNDDINATMHSHFNLVSAPKPATATLKELVADAPANSTDVITKSAPEGATCTNTLAYDGTVDNNLRYVGVNPCNYATFNGEIPSKETKWVIIRLSDNNVVDGPFENQDACQTIFTESHYSSGYVCQSKIITTGGWRVIGIMNNINNSNRNSETRIKLIRNDPLGDYSWDTSSSNVNRGWGINDWVGAALKYELNGDYLDASLMENVNWYNGSSNQQEGIFDYTKRLSESAQGLIAEAKWHLGKANIQDNPPEETLTVSKFYEYERETNVDSEIPNYWFGKVALLYPSDFGYAVSDGTFVSRTACIQEQKILSGTNGMYECTIHNWLNKTQWTLTPQADYPFTSYPQINYPFTSLLIEGYGGIQNYTVSEAFPIYPVVYLDSGVSISGGNGTESDPFIFSIPSDEADSNYYDSGSSGDLS